MRTRILFLLMLFPTLLMAEFVPQYVAEQVAINFFLSLNQSGEPAIEIVESKGAWGHLPVTPKGSDVPPYYIFNMTSTAGFVIISADDCVIPILGYSLTSNYNGSDIPPAMIKWLDDLRMQVNYVAGTGEAPPEEITRLWNRYLTEGSKDTPPKGNVSPLLQTTWNQSPYYNDLCPGGSVSGCVATAMTQIMKFWNYPEQGSGFHSYNHHNYGTLSANFGSEQYQWSLMPNNVNSTNEAVATLTYHAGVAVEMNYSPQSSGAYVISSHSPVEHCAEHALKNYFGYDQSTLQGVAREDYTTAQWMNIIKDELGNGRPVLYAGFGNGGGHAFVCDGYDTFDYLHMNWGWGGYYDGYFPVDALDPSGTGTGGGTGGYNSGHQAVIGIQPPNGGGGGGGSYTDVDMRLYDELTINQNPINYGQAFTIHTDIVNYGPDNFIGDYCAAAFDEEGIFVEFIEILSGWELGSGYHYTNGITFTTDGLLSLLPGNYYIGIFYKLQDENWMLIEDGNYLNQISLTVEYSNDIELYDDIIVDGGTTMTQFEGISATVALGNYGTWDFNGIFDLSFYYMDGTLAQTIATSDPLTLQAGYFNTYTFSNSYIDLQPGTYLLAVLMQETGGNWELAGSSLYTNPIKVVVQEALIPEDQYENNDTQDNAFTFTPVFHNNEASITTPDANSHNGTDVDFFKINLESGYEYTITARAHDSYNSATGQQYTNDVLWSYNIGDEWSNVFDDVCDHNIIIEDGGKFYFLVAPYFEGETGTYFMDIQISRTPLGIKNHQTKTFEIHPNPVHNVLNISSVENAIPDNIEIVNLSGKTIPVTDINPMSTGIDVSFLTPGMYFLRMYVEDRIYTSKFIKH